MLNYLEETRSRIGDPPRVYSLRQKAYNHVRPPTWLRRNPVLKYRRIYDERILLFKNGLIGWGYVVQANVDLFEEGKTDLPAAIVYSVDKFYDLNLELLASIASRLYQLKEKTPKNPKLRRLVGILNDQHRVVFNLELPEALAKSEKVYYTTIVVHRKHLPSKYLHSSWFPILAKPGHMGTAMVLPVKYWALALVDYWLRGS